MIIMIKMIIKILMMKKKRKISHFLNRCYRTAYIISFIMRLGKRNFSQGCTTSIQNASPCVYRLTGERRYRFALLPSCVFPFRLCRYRLTELQSASHCLISRRDFSRNKDKKLQQYYLICEYKRILFK